VEWLEDIIKLKKQHLFMHLFYGEII